MTTILVTCPDCGNSRIRPKDVIVHQNFSSGEATYLFNCPVCKMNICKEADDHVQDSLAACGCKFVIWDYPEDLTAGAVLGKPIDDDLIIDLHEIMKDDNWIERVEALM